ncbi:alpha/beta hydrolase [Lactococcus lactis]|uniref:alpha/beta fold hydrolase n=1 Tax=Lactococcus lactis TaxID=1358 RepID=UPI002415B2B2|nr:alpha/beta hydrolase [Lactococcus lactis]MDG4974927.1 alpha/beta hydrolase [Lactococcus lactis]
MKHININTYKLSYLQKGNTAAKPIMVIGSSIYYPRLFKDEIFENLNLIFLDHRGFVLPESTNVGYSLEEVVEDIEMIRQQLEIESMYILGHSGHGFMAMAYAAKYGKYVAGIILSNLAPTNSQERQDVSLACFERTASKNRKKYFYSEIDQLAGDIKSDPNKRFTHMNIRMQAHSFYDYHFDGAYLWNDVENNMPALDYLWGKAFAIFDTETFLRNWGKKVILLLSDNDYLVAPTSLWDDIAKENDIEIIKFSKSGHNPMLEEPYAYFNALKKFINA